MNMHATNQRYALVLIFLLLATLSSCGESDVDGKSNVLRFSVIPDWNEGKLAADSVKLATLLSKQLGVEVRYEPSSSYTACVNALAANKIDFAWLGGKTTCDAIDECKGAAHVLVTRDIDLYFKSYFIGNREVIASGKLAAIEDLGQWQALAGGLRFTFGSVNSTSGHLMPRHFLAAAGIAPDQAFASVGYAVGGHAGVLQSVASGAVDCGALNYAYYDMAPAAEKAKAPILYTTPDYVDYAWVVHDRIGAHVIDKLRAAMTGLDRSDAIGREILDAWSAGSFLLANDQQWDAIRKVRDSLPKDFLK